MAKFYIIHTTHDEVRAVELASKLVQAGHTLIGRSTSTWSAPLVDQHLISILARVDTIIALFEMDQPEKGRLEHEIAVASGYFGDDSPARVLALIIGKPKGPLATPPESENLEVSWFDTWDVERAAQIASKALSRMAGQLAAKAEERKAVVAKVEATAANYVALGR